MKRNVSGLFISVAVFVVFLIPSLCLATLINLNSFTADSTVSVSQDGSSAVFLEDPSLFSVALRHNSYPIPVTATSLSFMYNLQVPENNEDYFHAYLGSVNK